MAFVEFIRFITSHPLSNSPARSLARFLAWQVSNRLFDARRVVRWIDDARLIVGLGETGLTGNVYVGLMEYEDMGFLSHYLGPDIVFLDVGANVGAYTTLAAKVCGSRVISFEPVGDTYTRLHDQIWINDIGHLVDLKRQCVGAERGSVSFTIGLDTTNHVVSSLDGDNTASVMVEVVTLDSVFDPDQRYAMKIDVEGFEMKVIQGGARLLKSGNVGAVVIELNGSGQRYGIKDEDIDARLKDFGLRPVRYDPRTREITAISGINPSGGNTIYVKDVSEVIERVRRSPKRVIHTAGSVHL